MKKKFLMITLSIFMIFNSTACGNTAAAEPETDTHDHIHLSESAEDTLFTVELTLPADYTGDSTQEELDQLAKEAGYKSITLNEDGSATYIMTEAQHEQLLTQVSNNLNATLAGMIGAEGSYNFTQVTANSDFTAFMVRTVATEMGTEESNAILTLLMLSGIYHTYKGSPADNVHIDFVNIDTEDTIYVLDTSDMENN